MNSFREKVEAFIDKAINIALDFSCATFFAFIGNMLMYDLLGINLITNILACAWYIVVWWFTYDTGKGLYF